ncbi:hypothetical protein [Francisella halioticida]|nr:hypothetical protein [Francisella halioticida]
MSPSYYLRHLFYLLRYLSEKTVPLYLLNVFKNETNQVVIDKANKVWSADIT